jgi:Cytochrome P450
MHHLTMTQMANSYQPMQSLESKKLLHDLLISPAQYERHFERYASGLVFRIGYGKTVETGDEPYVRRILEVVHNVERVASPGAYLVDTIPLLKYLPSFIAPFKGEAEELHKKEIGLFRELLIDVKTEMDQGEAPLSFARTYWENQDEYGLSVDEAAYVIGTLFEAGSGTTAAAMMSFILSMCLHPEWQQKGQKEVDDICGDGMPQFEDIPRLPTVRAIIKEVARWRPVTAGGTSLNMTRINDLGVPHQLVKDDEYNGFFFPVGTNIHANQWSATTYDLF